MILTKARVLLTSLSTKVNHRRCCSGSLVDLSYDDYNTNTDNSLTPLVISHGMLGSKHNWTSIAKQIHKTTGRGQLGARPVSSLATGRRVLTVDARNHGDSPHTEEMTYDLMAGDLARLVGSCNLGTVSLAGHSMGGRTVMMAAVKQVIDIDRLIVLDISPVNQTFDVTSNNEWNMEHYFHCLKVIVTSSHNEFEIQFLVCKIRPVAADIPG